ncbi:hypothetical protein L484_024102 [Morus notabilis]|uniref:Uncharacterized protein n=1 Tax=Morus notabilis TaxID=981085 RepID=W9RPS6_9ROSA|nr:hypothetical protein L484_024102 [Morus notabilis]
MAGDLPVTCVIYHVMDRNMSGYDRRPACGRCNLSGYGRPTGDSRAADRLRDNADELATSKRSLDHSLDGLHILLMKLPEDSQTFLKDD